MPGDSFMPQSLSNCDPGPGETRINATHLLEICLRGTKHTEGARHCFKPSQALPSRVFQLGFELLSWTVICSLLHLSQKQERICGEYLVPWSPPT